jgi:hypothetical protein
MAPNTLSLAAAAGVGTTFRTDVERMAGARDHDSDLVMLRASGCGEAA